VLCLGEAFPKREADEEEKANDKGCHDMRIARIIDCGPNDAHKYWHSTSNEEKCTCTKSTVSFKTALLRGTMKLTDIIYFLDQLIDGHTVWMRRWEIHEQKTQEGQELCNRSRPEIPLPTPSMKAVESGDRSENHGEKGRQVRNDNADMSPLVGQKLRESKCSHLAVATSKSGNGHTRNDSLCVWRRCDDYMTDYTDKVATD
jgi:hypothetical protein